MSSELESRFALIAHARKWPSYEREYRFCPARKWRFDFCWPDHMVAVELEGGVWIGGRHTRGAGYTRDCEKHNWAAVLGWRLLRYTSEMLDRGACLDILDALLKEDKMQVDIDMPRLDIIELIRLFARAYNINETVALRQIWQESRFDPRAVSPSDCRGLAQLNPRFYGERQKSFWYISDFCNPFQNLMCWAGTMRWLLTRYDGDYEKALAAYNAGVGTVDRLIERHGDNWKAHLDAEPMRYLEIALGDEPSMENILSGAAE